MAADLTTSRPRKAGKPAPVAPSSVASAPDGVIVASEDATLAPVEAAPAMTEAATDASANMGANIETMTDQAGAVAAEAIEPLADAVRETIDTMNEAAPADMATPDASPFINLLKGMTMATAFDPSRPQAMLGDMNEKAKGAMEKGAKFAEDFSDFTKGNVEAMVASGRVAAKGVEEMAQYGADYGRKSMEQATAAMKSFASIKSPTELFQLQSEYTKSAVDSMVSETSKFTESYLKLLGDIAQPLASRYAVAADKIKAVAA